MAHRIFLLCWAIFSFFSAIAGGQTTLPSPTASELFKRVASSVVMVVAGDGKNISQGTGFLVSEDGRIVTNYHVIAHMDAAIIRFPNGDIYDTVDVVDVDKRKDIVVLKIKAVELPYLNLGKSANIEVGAKVYTISNPRGLDNTLSEGIVSAVGEGEGFRRFQITAPISHGSSGGPVFDSRGNVIAIVQATDEGGQNLNFCIPIDYAKGLLTTITTQPWSAIYEPPPAPTEAVGNAPPPSKAPNPSEGMRKGILAYLESKLYKWTPEDAKVELGEPVSQRPAFDNKVVDGVIYAYPDPTRAVLTVELNFDGKTNHLRGIYAYPQNATLANARDLWGANYKISKLQEGKRAYVYQNRRIILTADHHDRIISICVY
jgi:S1-C subfamily serine protease